MNKQHKHAELIKQWADGSEIECYYKARKEWHAVNEPAWWGDFEFRVTPVKKGTKKYRLVVAEIDDNSSNSSYKDVSDDVKNYWKLTEFVELFETDGDNQCCEVYRSDIDNRFTVVDMYRDTTPSLGVIRMSENCARKLCVMLNNGDIEL